MATTVAIFEPEFYRLPSDYLVRREGLEPPTRCFVGIASIIGIRRRKKPDIVPQYDDRPPYTRPIAA